MRSEAESTVLFDARVMRWYTEISFCEEGDVLREYKSRVIDQVIANRLRNKGAILVEGAKWCGKTTTCEQHANSVLYTV